MKHRPIFFLFLYIGTGMLLFHTQASAQNLEKSVKPLAKKQDIPALPGTPAKAAAKSDAKTGAAKDDGTGTTTKSGYRIDQPGTITFTVGMVIKGKIEKPQVMIFLPKERPFYRELKFTHSFSKDMAAPLPFEPLLE